MSLSLDWTGLDEPTFSNLWIMDSIPSKSSLFIMHVNAIHNQYQVKNQVIFKVTPKST